MTQTVVALTGVSGVGKTTFIHRLAKRIPFQHLTGGSLIAQARDGTDVPRDALRQFDLDDNQRLLIKGFMAARDRTVETVLFDGHVVIDGPEGLMDVPVSVFQALGICLMVHLEADPVVIKRNREHDQRRARPLIDTEALQEQQRRSRRHATSIAQALNVECLVLQAKDLSVLEAQLSV